MNTNILLGFLLRTPATFNARKPFVILTKVVKNWEDGMRLIRSNSAPRLQHGLTHRRLYRHLKIYTQLVS